MKKEKEQKPKEEYVQKSGNTDGNNPETPKEKDKRP